MSVTARSSWAERSEAAERLLADLSVGGPQRTTLATQAETTHAKALLADSRAAWAEWQTDAAFFLLCAASRVMLADEPVLREILRVAEERRDADNSQGQSPLESGVITCADRHTVRYPDSYVWSYRELAEWIRTVALPRRSETTGQPVRDTGTTCPRTEGQDNPPL